MQEGDRVPNLTVTTETGRQTTLDALRDGRIAVFFFYPQDETPLCTKEACAFRDAYADFTDRGAVVLGISGDTAASHRAFQANHDLPYTLLADEDGALRAAFGVPRFLGLLDGRSTYVVDADGVVQHVFNARFSAQPHVDEALRAVDALTAED